MVHERVVVGGDQYQVILPQRLGAERHARLVEVVLAHTREHRHVRIAVIHLRALLH